jgi:phosphoglucosamine mutase
VISASHNRYEDNGVKLFAAGGRKLSDEVETALEAELHSLLAHEGTASARTGDAVGTVVDGRAQVRRWSDSIVASIDGRTLEGVSLVVDCANGAASGWAPDVLRGLGATVEVLHDEPDGTNINAGCGSTYPEDLQKAVVKRGADAGLAFDGDADRVLAVDADGRLIDGDQIIAITAIDRRDRDRLAKGTVVATVMANLGFRLGMHEHGIKVLEVPVGDRYVLEAMADEELVLGGEQSGHVIFGDLATTGDGLLTAVQLLDVVHRAQRPLGELADAAMTRLPQVLRNVRVAEKDMQLTGALADEIAKVEAELGDHGRVLVRGSGTEPLVRVMVEAPSAEVAEAAAQRLVDVVEAIGPDSAHR